MGGGQAQDDIDDLSLDELLALDDKTLAETVGGRAPSGVHKHSSKPSKSASARKAAPPVAPKATPGKKTSATTPKAPPVASKATPGKKTTTTTSKAKTRVVERELTLDEL